MRRCQIPACPQFFSAGDICSSSASGWSPALCQSPLATASAKLRAVASVSSLVLNVILIFTKFSFAPVRYKNERCEPWSSVMMNSEQRNSCPRLGDPVPYRLTSSILSPVTCPASKTSRVVGSLPLAFGQQARLVVLVHDTPAFFANQIRFGAFSFRPTDVAPLDRRHVAAV